MAFGYHLPERMTREFFALTLLDPLLVSDESAKMYQALIKENQIASAVSGGFNYGLGNNWDYNGPMLYTFRVEKDDFKVGDRLDLGRLPETGRNFFDTTLGIAPDLTGLLPLVGRLGFSVTYVRGKNFEGKGWDVVWIVAF